MIKQVSAGYIMAMSGSGGTGVSLVRSVTSGFRLECLVILLLFAGLMASGFLLMRNDPEVKSVGLMKWKPTKSRFLIAGTGLTAGGSGGFGAVVLSAVEGKVSGETITLGILVMGGLLVAGIFLLTLVLTSTASQKIPQK